MSKKHTCARRQLPYKGPRDASRARGCSPVMPTSMVGVGRVSLSIALCYGHHREEETHAVRWQNCALEVWIVSEGNTHGGAPGPDATTVYVINLERGAASRGHAEAGVGAGMHWGRKMK
jgi:hypothetical protein